MKAEAVVTVAQSSSPVLSRSLSKKAEVRQKKEEERRHDREGSKRQR